MHCKLLGILLFACSIILNDSTVIGEDSVSVTVESVEPSSTTEQPATLPEGYVAFPDVHAAYKLYKIDTTWNEARNKCIEENTRLAIADTHEKIVHMNTLRTNNELGKWVHVGIYYTNTTNQWVRVDNDLPVTSLPWEKEYPDEAGTGNCVGIVTRADTLLNYECDEYQEWFVCEISI